MKKLIIIFAVIFTASIFVSCTKTNFVSSAKTKTGVNAKTEASFAYRFVIWNGKTYAATSEKVSSVESKIGSVEYYSDEENGTFKNGSSNFFKVGTNLYSIKNVSADDSIAAETSKGQFEKLTKEN